MSSAICVDHQLSQIPSRKLLMISKCNETGGGAHYDHEDDIDCDDPYSSDHFRMYEFKVRRCTRSRSHDWTDCPFVHPGEKARRRDPRKYHYSGEVCPEFRQGGECRRGDNCEFAHGVFECWLHPSRYRTEACKDGKSCKRKICFFAHTPRQLRILPEVSSKRSLNKINSPCSTCLLRQSLLSSSPTSTLLGLSPPMSPSSPLSPAKHRSPLSGFSPISRYNDRLSKIMSYENMVNELMSSLEAVSFNDYEQEYAGFSPSSSGSGDFFNNGEFMDESKFNLGASYDDPDLGWVNELLM